MPRIHRPEIPDSVFQEVAEQIVTTERQRDLATDQRSDARRIVEEARMEAAALLNMEREHLGSGRDGHISETDLIPLLRVLQIDPDGKP